MEKDKEFEVHRLNNGESFMLIVSRRVMALILSGFHHIDAYTGHIYARDNKIGYVKFDLDGDDYGSGGDNDLIEAFEKEGKKEMKRRKDKKDI